MHEHPELQDLLRRIEANLDRTAENCRDAMARLDRLEGKGPVVTGPLRVQDLVWPGPANGPSAAAA